MKTFTESIKGAGSASPRAEIATITVCQLFISRGHNFFGHHGRPAGQNEILEVEQIECVSGRGIRGDRFFDYKEDYKGQITFFSKEVFEAMKIELECFKLHPSAMRRNVLVSGAQLNRLIGLRFEVQGIVFEGSEECRPCYWMDKAICAGAEKWLCGRGGLRARILTSGTLRVTWMPRIIAA
jgi:MOSC domain-containing protein YiiM